MLAPSPQGLHARPAARVVETARRFAAETVLVIVAEGVPDGPAPAGRAKDLLDVLALGVVGGTPLVIEGRGHDAAAAVAALEALFADLAREP